MAAYGNFGNMYDISLKPRLLATLLREHVPDDSRPFSDPSELASVAATLRVHKLLSESVEDSTDKKLVESWKKAVDAWVDRLLLLVSSDVPDKCWAGVCLLGITCQDCSSHRFLASYSSWYQKLHAHVQAPGVSKFVRVASIASLSDLFTRLGQFPNVKKDGISFSGKLIQPFLNLLDEDGSEALWDGGTSMLCTIICYFPSAIHRHYDSVESAIASKIMSGKCSTCLLKKLAHCLSILPQLKGDEETWSLLMRKILLLINSHLNDAFQCLEEETKSTKIVNLLVPPGKDPPTPLGCRNSSDKAAVEATKRPKRLLTSSVSAFILCGCEMLTNPYPVQVNIPVKAVLALIERVLTVDGSVSQSLLPFVTATQQESLCSELPMFHSDALDLLIGLTKGMRSQMLPHAAYIVRLIMRYFKNCSLPELRVKLYSIIRTLLMSMGVGIAKFLTQEVINNVFIDLNPDHQNDVAFPITLSRANEVSYPNRKKRKHASAARSLEDKNETGFGEAPKNHLVVPASVKIAALEALEVLLTVGGALRSDSWRKNVDTLLISVAADSVHDGWNIEENSICMPNELISMMEKLQLAALRALLASLLSQSHVRPANIARGLELFQRGRQETGTMVAEFCAHALLALEVLIHPRALPLEDYSPATTDSFGGFSRRFAENVHSSGQPIVAFSQRTELALPDSYDDELHSKWLQNQEKPDTPLDEQVKKAKYSKESGDSSRAISTVKEHDYSLDKSTTEKSKTSPPEVDTNDMEMEDRNPNIVKSPKHGESTRKVQEHPQQEPVLIPCIATASKCAERDTKTDPSSSGAVDHENREDGLEGNVVVTPGDGISASGEMVMLGTLDSGKGKEIIVNPDDESSVDVFPDIIDVEPDSDEE
ncbi:proline-, glutamic acid- and leucine-rich protein 1 [Rhodamnia argentea]|uniref:Proline-, glutamic acid- and leucine-rich protein 1 n=1 Tax=Rhodamnia argentea TaxID=178133 RepID=A0A8B8NWF9_9MYRT|nr:proline-, glutamic acid- and leucine-rich protein 1 [Rhodamnia argentea]